MGLNSKILAFHRKVVDPGERGACLALSRGALALASVPYGVAVQLRNRGYDRRRRPVHHAGAPVICIGNITVNVLPLL